MQSTLYSDFIKQLKRLFFVQNYTFPVFIIHLEAFIMTNSVRKPQLCYFSIYITLRGDHPTGSYSEASKRTDVGSRIYPFNIAPPAVILQFWLLSYVRHNAMNKQRP